LADGTPGGDREFFWTDPGFLRSYSTVADFVRKTSWHVISGEPGVCRRKRIERDARWYKDEENNVWRYRVGKPVFYCCDPDNAELSWQAFNDEHSDCHCPISFSEAAAILTARGQDPYIESEDK
jgi:hypothetical protein